VPLSDFVVLDIETTGLSRHIHKITELAALKVKDGVVVREFDTLVNPQIKIPRFITQLTGITDEMVKDAEPIGNVLPRFARFIGNNVIVAHNATFDYGFLRHNVETHLNSSMINEKLCTRKLAHRLLPELPSKRLSCVCRHFNINNKQEHRAMGDARATHEVFSKFLDILKEKGINDKETLFRFESTPSYKLNKMFELNAKKEFKKSL
jgi:DNA polymerase-3 subunit alpha (Gram-positive type)